MRSRFSPATGVAMLLGIALGLGLYTFGYAKGSSYLTDDPAACVNCHVMREHHQDWTHSSHRSVATCNDCHTPSAPLGKYATKALNGFWHSFAFTTGRFEEPIRIKGRNRSITEQACRRCHAEIVAAIDPVSSRRETTSCLRCHANVAHLP